MKIDCWEFNDCGRVPGGYNVKDMGLCPAGNEIWCDEVQKSKKVAGNFAGPLLSSRYFTFGSGINLEPCGNTAGFCMSSPCPPYYTFPGGHGSGFKKNVSQVPGPIG